MQSLWILCGGTSDRFAFVEVHLVLRTGVPIKTQLGFERGNEVVYEKWGRPKDTTPKTMINENINVIVNKRKDCLLVPTTHQQIIKAEMKGIQHGLGTSVRIVTMFLQLLSHVDALRFVRKILHHQILDEKIGVVIVVQ